MRSLRARSRVPRRPILLLQPPACFDASVIQRPDQLDFCAAWAAKCDIVLRSSERLVQICDHALSI